MSERLLGVRPATADLMRATLTDPHLRENDACVYRDRHGRFLGLWVLHTAADASEVRGYRVLAHVAGGALAGAMIRDIEERAAAVAPTLEGGAGAVALRLGSLVGDAADHELLERHGYRGVREFLLMRRALHSRALDRATWPRGIVVHPFVRADADRVYDALAEAFADHWGPYLSRDSWKHAVFCGAWPHDPALWFVAHDGDAVAGVCWCTETFPEQETYGYVAELAVRPAWRGRGLGRALLLRAFEALAARGRAGVALHVDGASVTGATRLYRRVGMTPQHRYRAYEKPLAASSDRRLTTEAGDPRAAEREVPRRPPAPGRVR